ncbi:TFIIE alpha subunit [Apiospora rasikravindrae]|uniref:TFIIE alpha subunit n=1 Tax=Apiospora rasikravindrae TaxID=990691 RepID=A0ABR1SL96_9PEZI
MDKAQTLVRSVARAFYDPTHFDPRHIVIIDALITHSALRDDDLSYLMAQNTKDLHKICGKLREDRFIEVHVRAELREGQQRPSNRTYYYIDYRKAIDAIKWRVYTLDKAVQGNAVPASEKKEYFCSYCGSDWTAMEVLDKMGPEGFMCHTCGSLLQQDPERQSGGHEQSTRLNNQLKFITDLLPELDSVLVPEMNFEKAYASARPVERDATNQVAASVAVDSSLKPTAVKGMANTGPTSIAINITASDGPDDATKEAERAKKEKIAQQNALPEWHTTSTVTGASYSADASASFKKDDEEDKKPEIGGTADEKEDAALDDLFERLKKEQEEAARKAAEEDEDEEEDDEEDEFEDIPAAGNVTAPSSQKRPSSSADTSAANTPASEERPLKKVKVEEPADNGDSEDEDMAFEDV